MNATNGKHGLIGIRLLVAILMGALSVTALGTSVSAVTDESPEPVECIDIPESVAETEQREQPAHCGPSGGGSTGADGATAPVTGFFHALFDRRIDDLSGYMCGDRTWHSILGSQAYGVDAAAWWRVLKFTPSGPLDISIKDQGQGPGGQDEFAEEAARDKQRELDGSGKADELAQEASDAVVEPDKIDQPFDPDKKPSDAFDESVKPKDLEVPDPGKELLEGDLKPSDKGDQHVDPFDPSKKPIDAWAIVRVQGNMKIGVGDRKGVRLQVKKTLREASGRIPDRLMLDLAAKQVAKGRKVSLNQDLFIALIGDKWLICPEPGGGPKDSTGGKGKKRAGATSDTPEKPKD